MKKALISSSENDHLLNTLFYTGDCRNIKNTYIKGINTTEKNKNKDFQKNTFKQLRKLKKEYEFILSFLLDGDNGAFKVTYKGITGMIG